MSGNNHTTQVSWSLPFETEPDRNNGFSPASTNAQLAIEELRNSFKGKGFQTAFIGNGTVKNEWLKSEDANILSNHSPDILKYDARCVGIDFTNASIDADPLLIICISNAGSGRDLDRFYKWTLTDVRVASYTHETLGFNINAGDKMAVYLRDVGTDSVDCAVTMDFIVINSVNQFISENYTLDFKATDIPATNLIPEIFTP